ncbi:MAG TPA: amidohydrolase family protein [Smithellaceae bacterium]|nr:amidohydrolase family protein [Smithellaceae bacterium]
MSRNAQIGKITRRRLLQASAVSALSLSFPGMSGCVSSLPNYQRMNVPSGKPLALISGNVVDVVSGSVLQNKVIIIRQGTIEALTDRVPEPQDAFEIIDLKHQYVIPGLIDAHCHSTLTSQASLHLSGFPLLLRQLKRNYIQQLAHGVTTIRDVGAMPKLLQDGLKMIERGEIIGPRVVYCNAFTNIYGGHPDIAPRDISVFSDITLSFTGNPSLWFQDTTSLKKGMEQNLAGGASFIKLTLDRKSLLCGRGDIPIYTDEHLRIIMDFAQKHQLPVAGHIHTKFGFDRALQYGISSMEHTIADTELSDRDLQIMTKKNVAIVPTMIIAQMLAAEEAYDQLPSQYVTDFITGEQTVRRAYLNANLENDIEPDIHRANVASLENYKRYGCEQLFAKSKFAARPEIYFDMLLHGPKNLLKMKQAGVLIGCGTDSGVPFIYHGSLWREMEMLGRIGFTPQEVLQCATVNNAKILKMSDKIGTLEKGKAADMAVLKDNPLEKIEACRAPRLVIRDGQIYDVSKKDGI